jgi:hypothetical protein
MYNVCMCESADAQPRDASLCMSMQWDGCWRKHKHAEWSGPVEVLHRLISTCILTDRIIIMWDLECERAVMVQKNVVNSVVEHGAGRVVESRSVCFGERGMMLLAREQRAIMTQAFGNKNQEDVCMP